MQLQDNFVVVLYYDTVVVIVPDRLQTEWYLYDNVCLSWHFPWQNKKNCLYLYLDVHISICYHLLFQNLLKNYSQTQIYWKILPKLFYYG